VFGHKEAGEDAKRFCGTGGGGCVTKIVPMSSRAPLSGRDIFLWKSLGGMAPELHALAPPEPDLRRSHLNGTFGDTISNGSLRRGGRGIQDVRTTLVLHPVPVSDVRFFPGERFVGMNLFKSNPEAKLRKQYQSLMKQAMEAQRKGDIVGCSERTAEAESVLRRIEAAGGRST